MAAGIVARCPSSRDPSVVYDVRLAGDGRYLCECPGFARWKHCRHATALAALKAVPLEETASRIPNPDPPASTVDAITMWEL